MPIEAVTQSVSGPVYILHGNDDINVAAGQSIRSLDTDAITTWTGRHTITVSGVILAYDDAINTIGVTEAQTVEIYAGAVLNAGYLNSPVEDADGVILDGLNSTLNNRGTIIAQGSGVQVFVRDGGTTTITNSGTMIADKYGIWNKFGAGTLNFTNTGTIESGLGSYRGGESVDLVTNSGLMNGTVDLAGGNDVYVGTGGRVIGQILGGTGDDRFVLGNFADNIVGGDGTDTLDLTLQTARITVDLSNAANNVGAVVAGDTYTGIETVIGGSNSDTLTGDGMNNSLIGAGGRDRLSGGAGGDTLSGGIGDDTMTGGTGADVFVFNTSKDGGDIITDFATGMDMIRLSGTGFGLGNQTGAVSASLFVSGLTNAALDGDDRFIFRSTDATLWYDRDGSGVRDAIMLADLADGTVLNLWDLTLV